MGATSVRRQAITAVQAHQSPVTSFAAAEAPGEVFGQNVFT